MKGKTKQEKGITLIALIITIVVLMILAAVAISSITNYGILGHAQNAAVTYNNAVANEQAALDKYLEYLENGGSTGSQTKTVAEVKNVKQDTNTKVVDEYGNQIVIPAGFKIRVDEGTRTKGDAKSLATNVTQGIVIEDKDGNQFVWVPVGDIYTTDDEATKETTKKTITLGRYSNFSTKPYTPATTISDYTEDTEQSHPEGYNNAIARNINHFTTSATTNKGYYIGRYEAGKTSDNKLVCKTGQTVYANITQPNAATACRNMYNNGADGYSNGTYSSDLINSYAWDTAIIFIQTFGGIAASRYYDDNNSDEFTTTGGNEDEYFNINDMSGNAMEWSTETCSLTGVPCVFRGGYYRTYNGYAYNYASTRYSYNPSYSYESGSFRPLLYVAL